jgi:hypothetical protein
MIYVIGIAYALVIGAFWLAKHYLGAHFANDALAFASGFAIVYYTTAIVRMKNQIERLEIRQSRIERNLVP